MNVSDGGLGAVRRREGCVLKMYLDSAGLPTIGVGHLLTKEELETGILTVLGCDWRHGITQEQADALLRYDLKRAEEAVTYDVTVRLSPHQFDALVSFVFNVGENAFRGSTLLRLLNAGHYDRVPDQLRRWVHAGGRVDPILIRRREDEIRQWEGRT